VAARSGGERGGEVDSASVPGATDRTALVGEAAAVDGQGVPPPTVIVAGIGEAGVHARLD